MSAKSIHVVIALLLATTLPATADEVLVVHETFDDGIGDFLIDNSGDPLSGWAFDNECPNAHGSASGAGVLRWGHFVLCSNYGETAHADRALTPMIVPAITVGPGEALGCDLTFSYSVDLEEPQFNDVALVYACNIATCERLMHTQDGDFVLGGAWNTAQRQISLEPPFWVEFGGAVDDGILNDGYGYSIDDVEIRCDTSVVTPATDTAGTVVLLALMSVVFLVTTLLRRRRGKST